MGGWYDYVPVVGSAVEAAKGDWGRAAMDIIPGVTPVYDAAKGVYNKYKGAIDEQKQGLQDASRQSAELANKLYGESMQGLGQAEAQFQPAKMAALYGYGDPAAMTGGPSMYPVAPPRPR